MKNLKFKFGAYLYNLVVVLVVAFLTVGLSPTVLVAAPLVALGTGTILHCVGMPTVAYMGLQVEIWSSHIQDELFKRNKFLDLFKKPDEENVYNRKVVHIPQSGGSGNVVKNRDTLPATVRKRNDSDIIYLLSELTTDPLVIPNADTKELNYDKRSSALGEDGDALYQAVAEYQLEDAIRTPAYGTYAASLIPNTRILSTTGDSRAATADGATGTRKAATLGDLQRLKTFLKKDRKWIEGKMWGLITDEMEADLFPANSQITATYSVNLTEAEKREGVAYKVQGFKLMTRESVYRINEDGDFLDFSAMGSATDDEASLFFNKDSIEFTYGGAELFQDLKNPVYYGDIYSLLSRSGGRAVRADFRGVALLKQAKTV